MEISAPIDEVIDLSEIEFLDPGRYLAGSQHGPWRALRRRAPVWWHDGPASGFWCVTRYADCDRILKDTTTFSSEHGTILASVGTGDSAGGLTITLMDPPRHTQVRTPAMRTMSHSILRRHADRIRAEIRRLVACCLEGEHDFAVVMRRLPLAVVGVFLGLPESTWDAVARWTTTSIAPEDPAFASPGGTVAETLRRAHHELFGCFSEVIRARRAEPRDDLISALLATEVDGARMEDWQVLLNCYSFVLGANVTTPHVATHTMLALVERPEVWAAVATDSSLLSSLVEEGVRWTSPTHHLVRRATVDTEISGVPISAGDWVCAWVASANRDESVFSDPYVFDPRRSPNPHLGFGGGPHYCIGAPSSRMALTILFEELLCRAERFELSGPLTHLYSNWVNGLVHMPLIAHPRR